MTGFRLFAVLLVFIGMLLVACGGGTPTFSDPALIRGERVFKRDCATCHSTKPGANLVGPSLDGIASRAGTREEGMDSRGYIQLSIIKPSEFVVDGFVDQMPATFGSSLSDEELENVIAYLMTLE
jgi:cytochrome c2